MSYRLDPELARVLAALSTQDTDAPSVLRGDWQALRETGNAGQAALAQLVPPVTGVHTTTYATTTDDGASIELRWYTAEEAGPSPSPAVVYAHGGGMILGSLDLYDEVVSWYAARTGVPFLSVGYRLAPDVTGTTLAEDVFRGLIWLHEHAGTLGVDPQRIAVMGDSGGGAPAAGTAILARNLGVPLARQILVYPMLDDRNQTPDPPRAKYLTWTHDNNYTAWRAVLGADFGTDFVSPVAAPARLTDFTGLAPAYLDVGDLDIFRDEVIAYAQNLARASVPIELHVHPGASHGWERLAPHSGIGSRAMADRARAVSSL
ncbi:alpha/beta hydrolase [Pseudonocardia xinjiangensis]|uniref:alpha/beta hydrolase n=1 Tax=Pseudonocardia xinjiangensis TaxID=75289 RepID=UPI003D8DCC01